MERRREYLNDVTDFVHATDSSIDISQHATSSEQPTDLQQLVTHIQPTN